MRAEAQDCMEICQAGKGYFGLLTSWSSAVFRGAIAAGRSRPGPAATLSLRTRYRRGI